MTADLFDAGGRMFPPVRPPGFPRDAEETVTRDELAAVLNLVKPMAMRTLREVRLGADRDGGYVVPDLPYDAAVSIGIGDETSFDEALAARGTPVWQLDHAIERPPVAHPLLRFTRKGWGVEPTENMLTLREIAGEGCLTDPLPGAKMRLLKFDAEGTEWMALADAPESAILPWAVIVGEFHGCDRLVDDVFRWVAHRALAKLYRYYCPVHLHPNNFGSLGAVHDILLPGFLEITWLRRDLDEFLPYTGPIPGPLDRPNVPGRPEIVLRPEAT